MSNTNPLATGIPVEHIRVLVFTSIMYGIPTYRQRVLDVFHRHDPLQAECLSVYDGVVNDLLRYWSPRDTEETVQQYAQGVLYVHGKQYVKLPEGLMAELLTLKSS